MTTHRPDDAPSGDALRDPRFDAAWRKLSREEPPPALDAAIRAAARREVGAAPRPAAMHVPSALRPQRWWWPLAAAATIGAIVIGLLQLASPDRVAPAERAVVSDVPATAPQTTGREAQSEPPSSEAKQATATDEKAGPPAADAAPPARPAETPTARKDAWPRSTPAEGGIAAPRGAPPSTSIPAGTEQKTRAKDGNAVAPAPLAEPFPAKPAPPAPEHSAAPVPKTEPAQAAAPPQDEIAAAPPAAMGRAQAIAPSAPSAPYAPDRRAQAQREVQPATATSASAAAEGVARDTATQRVAKRIEPRATDHPPLPVGDWIALIRRMRDEGRSDEAARELAAFRKEHPDHEQLLPPDLRNWRPPAR